MTIQYVSKRRRRRGEDNTKVGQYKTIDTTSSYTFQTWLTQKRIDEELKNAKFQMTVSKNQERTNTIKCIEKRILDQPLSDHRKYIIWRILSPYLLNVKKLPKEEAYSVMKEWLDKCDKLERLNFNSKIKIKRKVSQEAFIIVMAMTPFVTYIESHIRRSLNVLVYGAAAKQRGKLI